MRTASDVGEREQWFVGRSHVCPPQSAPDASIAERREHGAVVTIPRQTARFEHEGSDAALFEFPHQAFQAASATPFRTGDRAFVADDNNLDRVP